MSVKLGEPGIGNAKAVIESIRRSVEVCASGSASGVVTNPIHKKTLYEGGFAFPGHTEFIADLCGVDAPVMMLASPELRVVPVTVHLPLKQAIDRLSSDLIVATATITEQALKQDFAIDRPRLAISGLNPHAGEGGTLGEEDGTIIADAIGRLIAAGIDVIGPVPGDALFTPSSRPTFDAAICMYHDQALIPIKALDFDRAVNTTLGLPIVRTSPDHGTAFDIAGSGSANPSSLIASIRLAAEISAARRRTGVKA